MSAYETAQKVFLWVSGAVAVLVILVLLNSSPQLARSYAYCVAAQPDSATLIRAGGVRLACIQWAINQLPQPGTSVPKP